MNKNEAFQILQRLPLIRKGVARRSHRTFSLIYLPHHFEVAPAPFHAKIFEITESDELFSVIVAFRESAKTTIVSTSYPLWAIIGEQQKKFVLLVSQTQTQARQLLANVKAELENNELLKRDFGPFEEKSDEWGSQSIVLTRFGARISAVSVETSVRGLKHGAFRPDLIIFDDIQDIASTRSRDMRNKTYQWIIADAMTAGTVGKTKVIVVGNLLHEDSVVSRFREEIELKKRSGSFLFIPLLDTDGSSLWPAKYPNAESVELLRMLVGNYVIFEREYMLRILPDFAQVIDADWIQTYGIIPQTNGAFIKRKLIGCDLAISERSSADFTSLVCAHWIRYRSENYLYILPDVFNERVSFPKAIAAVRRRSTIKPRTTVFVEEVAYQKAFTQDLNQRGLDARGVSVRGMDKRERLNLTTSLIISGKILFPAVGAEDLIQQLVGFGTERYDDMADSFSTLVEGWRLLQEDEVKAKQDQKYVGPIFIRGAKSPYANPERSSYYRSSNSSFGGF